MTIPNVIKRLTGLVEVWGKSSVDHVVNELEAAIGMIRGIVAELRKIGIPEEKIGTAYSWQEELLQKQKELRMAATKGAAAFAAGFEKTANHGYAGENAEAWRRGYEHCRELCGTMPEGYVHPWMTELAHDIIEAENASVEPLKTVEIEKIISRRFLHHIKPKSETATTPAWPK